MLLAISYSLFTTCYLLLPTLSWSAWNYSAEITTEAFSFLGLTVSTGAARNDGKERLYVSNGFDFSKAIFRGIQEITLSTGSSPASVIVSSRQAGSNAIAGDARGDGTQRVYGIVFDGSNCSGSIYLDEFTWNGSSFVSTTGSPCTFAVKPSSAVYIFKSGVAGPSVTDYQLFLASGMGHGRAALLSAINSCSGSACDINIKEHFLGSLGSTTTWVKEIENLPNAIEIYAGISTGTNGANRVYVIGGVSVSSYAMSNVYSAVMSGDGRLGPWQAEPNLSDGRREHSVAYYNGHLYVTGGSNSSSSVDTIYSSTINSNGSLSAWVTEVSSLPTVRQDHRMVATNGRLYVTGGVGGVGVNASVLSAPVRADSSVGPWSAETNLPAGRQGHGMAVWNSSWVYVSGGVDSLGNFQTSVFIGVLNSTGGINGWSASTNTLTSGLHQHDMTAIGGRLYISGGYIPSATTSAVYSAEISSDGSIGSWRTETPLPEARTRHGMVTFNSRAFVLGGRNTNGDFLNTVYSAKISTEGRIGTVLDLSTWTTRSVATISGTNQLSRMAVGDGRNDGQKRIYAYAGSSNNPTLYEYSYSGSAWSAQTFTGSNICCTATTLAIGPGRGDGTNRLYSGNSEITWNGSSYGGINLFSNRTAGTPLPFNLNNGYPMALGIGPGRNDGKDRVYYLSPSGFSSADGKIYELSYESGGYYEPKAVVQTAFNNGGTSFNNLTATKFAISKARSDGIHQIYEGWGSPLAGALTTSQERVLVEVANATGAYSVTIATTPARNTEMAVDLASSTEARLYFYSGAFNSSATLTLTSLSTFPSAGSLTRTGLGFLLSANTTDFAKEFTSSITYTSAIASNYMPLRFFIGRYDASSGSAAWKTPNNFSTEVDTGALIVGGKFNSAGTFQLLQSTVSATTKLIKNSNTGSTTIGIAPDVGSWTASIQIPNNAYGGDVAVTVTPVTSFPPATNGFVGFFPGGPGGCGNVCPRAQTVIPTGVGLTVESSSPSVTPSQNLTFSLAYDKTAMANFDVRKLFLLRYSSASAQWEMCVGSSVPDNFTKYNYIDINAGVVTCLGKKTSSFQIMQTETINSITGSSGGSPSRIFGYPSPFSVSRHGTMRFANYESGETLKIYSLGGYFIKELTANAGGVAVWDGKDETGGFLAPGVYIAARSASHDKIRFIVLP